MSRPLANIQQTWFKENFAAANRVYTRNTENLPTASPIFPVRDGFSFGVNDEAKAKELFPYSQQIRGDGACFFNACLTAVLNKCVEKPDKWNALKAKLIDKGCQDIVNEIEAGIEPRKEYLNRQNVNQLLQVRGDDNIIRRLVQTMLVPYHSEFIAKRNEHIASMTLAIKEHTEALHNLGEASEEDSKALRSQIANKREAIRRDRADIQNYTTDGSPATNYYESDVLPIICELCGIEKENIIALSRDDLDRTLLDEDYLSNPNAIYLWNPSGEDHFDLLYSKSDTTLSKNVNDLSRQSSRTEPTTPPPPPSSGKDLADERLTRYQNFLNNILTEGLQDQVVIKGRQTMTSFNTNDQDVRFNGILGSLYKASTTNEINDYVEGPQQNISNFIQAIQGLPSSLNDTDRKNIASLFLFSMFPLDESSYNSEENIVREPSATEKMLTQAFENKSRQLIEDLKSRQPNNLLQILRKIDTAFSDKNPPVKLSEIYTKHNSQHITITPRVSLVDQTNTEDHILRPGDIRLSLEESLYSDSDTESDNESNPDWPSLPIRSPRTLPSRSANNRNPNNNPSNTQFGSPRIQQPNSQTPPPRVPSQYIDDTDSPPPSQPENYWQATKEERLSVYSRTTTPGPKVKVTQITPISEVRSTTSDISDSRGNKFRVLNSAYIDEISKKPKQDDITQTFLHILNYIAQSADPPLEKGQLISLIQVAKENNGISDFIKKNPRAAEETLPVLTGGIGPKEAQYISKEFQKICESCGIYTGRDQNLKKFVGLRLRFVSDEVLNKFADPNFNEGKETSINFLQQKIAKVDFELEKETRAQSSSRSTTR